MNLLWRDTGKTVRFFGVDGRAATGLILVLLHISLFTLALSAGLMIAFSLLERFDYTIPNAARKFRVILSGRKKKSKISWSNRRYRSG